MPAGLSVDGHRYLPLVRPSTLKRSVSFDRVTPKLLYHLLKFVYLCGPPLLYVQERTERYQYRAELNQ